MSATNPVHNGLNSLSPDELNCLSVILKPEAIESLKDSDITASQIREICEIIFTEDFGAIADCERSTISIPQLYSNISYTLSMNNILKYIPWEGLLTHSTVLSGGILVLKLNCREMDHQDTPAVSVYNSPYCTFDSCNRRYHQLLSTYMSQLYEQQEQIYNEFVSKPLTYPNPMQDLRNRSLRVMTMEKERKIQYIWAAHHMLQRKVIEMAQRGDPRFGNAIERIEIPDDDIVSYNRFVTEKTHLFSHKRINYYGKTVNIKVVGEFTPMISSGKRALEDDFGIDTYICIRLPATNTLLGCISFYKLWEVVQEENENNFSYLNMVTEKNHLPPERITPYALVAHNIYVLSNADDQNGDLPIHRLLAQIAIEVFLREDFNLLQVKTTSTLGGVFHAAGFRGSQYDNEILKSLKSSRKEKKHFAPLKDIKHSTLSIEKNQPRTAGASSSKITTRLLSKNKSSLTPATVQFKADGASQTWEEIIFSYPGPLLDGGKAPILPTYNFRDLTHYILPST